MPIKVLIKHSCKGIPIEIEGEVNEVKQLIKVGGLMNELYKVARKWRIASEKRRQRKSRKRLKPLPLESMEYVRNLYCIEEG